MSGKAERETEPLAPVKGDTAAAISAGKAEFAEIVPFKITVLWPAPFCNVPPEELETLLQEKSVPKHSRHRKIMETFLLAACIAFLKSFHCNIFLLLL
jgi:hypothetical protein